MKDSIHLSCPLAYLFAVVFFVGCEKEEDFNANELDSAATATTNTTCDVAIERNQEFAHNVAEICHSEYPVVSLWLHSSGHNVTGGQPHVMLAAYSDGRVIWSENNEIGGPPYRISHIDPALIETGNALITEELLCELVTDEPGPFIVDGPYSVLAVTVGDQTLSIKRPYPWRDEPDSQDAWFLARSSVLSLAPPEGEQPIFLRFVIRHWVPSSGWNGPELETNCQGGGPDDVFALASGFLASRNDELVVSRVCVERSSSELCRMSIENFVEPSLWEEPDGRHAVFWGHTLFESPTLWHLLIDSDNSVQILSAEPASHSQ